MFEHAAAGPSRLPHLQQANPRSPTRSHSLHTRSKGYMATINPDHLSPTSPTFPSPISSMRRALSYEDTRNTPAPPPLPPKDDVSPSDPLFKAARIKLSSMDQEAMRKLRSTMVDISGNEGSSRPHSPSTSPNNSMFPAEATDPRSRGSRRSTLSKLVVPYENDSDGSTPVPSGSNSQAAERYVLAVIGHSGVGKTSLLTRGFRQWGLSPSTSTTLPSGHIITSYTSYIQPGGKICIASQCDIVEIDITALHLESQTENVFPAGLPDINGAILCYDATRGETLQSIPEAIHRLVTHGLPTVMFACKSDPEAQLQVEAAYANSLGEPYNVGLIEVSECSNDGRSKMRNGIRWLIYKVELKAMRRRRKTPSQSSTTSIPGVLSPDSDGASSVDKIMWPRGVISITSTATSSKRASRDSDMRSSSSSLHWLMQGPFADRTVGSNASQLGPPGNDGHKGRSMGGPEGEVSAKAVDSDSATYISLEDLINRLFTKIVSSDDEGFVRSFFMTYRRFCQPHELMRLFLERYNEVESYAVVKDLRHWAIQKMTGALIDWTSGYPGDLADSVTQGHFREILALLLKHTFMAHLTAQLAATAETLDQVVDLDKSWALKPATPSNDDANHTANMPDPASILAQTDWLIKSELLHDYESVNTKSEVGTPMTKGSTPSLQTGSTTSLCAEEFKRKRSGSEPRLTIGSDRSLSRRATDEGYTQWSGAFHYVLTVEPRNFALELTRMQWQLFSAVRPRDVFRHDLGKERDEPVGKAIEFFNHLSRWISTIILADPKPKHRARVYERFMMIAHQLRRLHNYDSLCAVLSGMRETSIYRLAQTHALVQPALEVVKDFQSHCKLMDPRANYVHYQRALDADVEHGRSAIPLLTPLLSLVNKLHSVRREDIRPDGTIQWDKFSRFGEILSIITECQARGAIANGPPSTTFVTIMTDIPVIHDEDGLFDRSRMLEPAGGGAQANMLRRFGKLTF